MLACVLTCMLSLTADEATLAALHSPTSSFVTSLSAASSVPEPVWAWSPASPSTTNPVAFVVPTQVGVHVGIVIRGVCSLLALPTSLPFHAASLCSQRMCDIWWGSLFTHESVCYHVVIAMQVNYVAKAGFAFPGGAPGAADVVSSFLQMSYLWELVRVQVGHSWLTSDDCCMVAVCT